MLEVFDQVHSELRRTQLLVHWRSRLLLLLQLNLMFGMRKELRSEQQSLRFLFSIDHHNAAINGRPEVNHGLPTGIPPQLLPQELLHTYGVFL